VLAITPVKQVKYIFGVRQELIVELVRALAMEEQVGQRDQLVQVVQVEAVL
jgi:hypothetical protein